MRDGDGFRAKSIRFHSSVNRRVMEPDFFNHSSFLIPKGVFLKSKCCSFERICLHFKALFRRFTGGKSRKSNAEMQAKTPKMRRGDFRNTP